MSESKSDSRGRSREDHFWQIGAPGSELEPMLEGWTTLGYMAAHSQHARLGLLVGGVHYRNPGLWVKAATTLDVLSGGRAWLGIGAGWNQAESEGVWDRVIVVGHREECSNPYLWQDFEAAAIAQADQVPTGVEP